MTTIGINLLTIQPEIRLRSQATGGAVTVLSSQKKATETSIVE